MKSLLTYIFLFLFKERKIAQYYLETGKIFTKTRDEFGEPVFISDNIFIHGNDVELEEVDFFDVPLVHISGICHIKDTKIGGNTNITGSWITYSSLHNASISWSRLSDVHLSPNKSDHIFTVVGDRVYSFSNVGTSRRKVYFDGNLVIADCFVGTIEELEERVDRNYTNATIAQWQEEGWGPILWYSDIIPIMKRIRSEINGNNSSLECPNRQWPEESWLEEDE